MNIAKVKEQAEYELAQERWNAAKEAIKNALRKKHQAEMDLRAAERELEHLTQPRDTKHG